MTFQEYQVGRFILRPFRQLEDGGQPISIKRKALELLSVLAGAQGALVTKDELMAAVWPHTVVGDNALQVQIASLRKLLLVDAHLLTTVHGFGYRLAATPVATRVSFQIGLRPMMDSRTARSWRGEQTSPRGRQCKMRVLPPTFVPRPFRYTYGGYSDDDRGANYADIIQLAQTCSKRAVLRLAELVQSRDQRVALLASQALLDKAFGKSPEFTGLSPVNGPTATERLRDFVSILVANLGDETAENAVRDAV